MVNQKILLFSLLLSMLFGTHSTRLHAAPPEWASDLWLLSRYGLSPQALELEVLNRYFNLNLTSPAPMAQVIMQIVPGSETNLRQQGYPVEAQIGNIVSVTVPVYELENLVSHPDVVAVSLAKSYRPLLDQSIGDIRGDELRTRLTSGEFEGLTGNGVIVAVIDSGIDWRHPDFRKPDGTTRIKYLWDPHDPSYTQSGGAVGSAPPPATQGTVYTESQINAALLGQESVNSTDECGHGTHVTGIAAGNGAAGGGGLLPGTFVGVAPEADIIAVRVFGADCNYLSGYINLVQAGSFIDQKAAELGKPYIINLSLGTQIGGHDGLELEEIAIDNLVGPGKKGKAVVVSAGNEGDVPVHAGGWFGPDGTSNNIVTIEVAQNGPKQALFDFWFSWKDNFTVTLEGGGKSPQDIQVGVAPFMRAKRLQFITDRVPFFTIKIQGQSVIDGRFDGWVEGDATFRTHVENSNLVSMPGTARQAITVAAHTTKTSWIDKYGQGHTISSAVIGAPTSFTSPGPTRDGRLKPELTAPGQVIASTLSGSLPGTFPPDLLILADNQHLISQGTSMSAPHVTGVFALLFQKYPQLNADLGKQLMTVSARQDRYTEPSPNPVTGFGKLDAAASLQPAEPRVKLSVNQPVFAPGEVLQLDFVLQSGEQETIIDGWVGVKMPDGVFRFLKPDGSGFDSQGMPYRPGMIVDDMAGRLFSGLLGEDMPVGKYTFYAVGAIPNTNPFDSSNWLTNLAYQTVEVVP